MTILITKISDREVPEHWRVLITVGETEMYHDSATTRPTAKKLVQQWLAITEN